MHDCNTIESKLVDMVFGELSPKQKLRLQAELETCPDCLSASRSMMRSLLLFDQAVESTVTDESYWPIHRANLQRRLEQTASTVTARRGGFWKRVFAARLPVPVPIAALVVLGLLLSSVFALRPSREVSAPPARPADATASTRIIEVPVFRDHVITRTFYVEKRSGAKREASQRPARSSGSSVITTRQDQLEGGEGGFVTRANLTDFQPTDEMRIRVLKRSTSDEN